MAESKAVLITGCSSGIGHATAARLAKNGWTVYRTARDKDKLSDLAGQGLQDAPARRRGRRVDDGGGRRGRAGGGRHRRADQQRRLLARAAPSSVPMDKVRKQFETNVFGLVRMTQLVLPKMREQGFGRIVNISSMGGSSSSRAAASTTRPSTRSRRSPTPALRGQGLRRGRRPDRTGADRHELQGRGRGLDRQRIARGRRERLRQVQQGRRRNHRGHLRGPCGQARRSPEAVAKVIDKAISSKRRPRYTVTPSAKLLMTTAPPADRPDVGPADAHSFRTTDG